MNDRSKVVAACSVVIGLLLVSILAQHTKYSALLDKLSGIQARLEKSHQDTLAQLNAQTQEITEQRKLLLAAQADAASLKARLAEQSAAIATVQAEQRTGSEKWQEQRVAVDQQTAILNRALGKFIPVELPPKISEQLASMTKRLGDSTTWPKTQEESDALTLELKKLIKAIPPWAEAEILPQINALRWDVVAATVLQRSSANTAEDISEFIAQADLALDSVPDGANEVLAKSLSENIESANRRLASISRKRALETAEKVLLDPDATIGQVSASLETLERIDFQITDEKEVSEKRQNLNAKLVVFKALNAVTEADGLLNQAKNEELQAIRQYKLGAALDILAKSKTELSQASGVPQTQTDMVNQRIRWVQSSLEDESERAKRAEAEKVRDYQRWALRQLEQYRSAMDYAEKADKGRFIDTPNYGYIRDAMIKHLLPIAPQYLEQGVARLYNEAYERGWKRLDGTSEKLLQLDVAKAEATTVKNKP